MEFWSLVLTSLEEISESNSWDVHWKSFTFEQEFWILLIWSRSGCGMTIFCSLIKGSSLFEHSTHNSFAVLHCWVKFWIVRGASLSITNAHGSLKLITFLVTFVNHWFKTDLKGWQPILYPLTFLLFGILNELNFWKFFKHWLLLFKKNELAILFKLFVYI